MSAAASTCLLAACLLAGTGIGCTPHGPEEPRLLRLVATDFAFESPRTIEAGLTRVRMVNQGHAWHYALVVALDEGATVDTYLAAARAGADFPAGTTDVGGTGLVTPGDSSEVVLDLRPGRYALLCWYDSHLLAGMAAPLTATETSAHAVPAPASDAEVVLREFAFGLSRPFRAGPQVLHVTNAGTRPHEFDVYRLEPGRSLADFEAWNATRSGAPPAEPVGGVGDFVPGREVWAFLDLQPGRYFMTCEVPEGAQSHADLGMVEEFVIP